jgi:hypothetical protein
MKSVFKALSQHIIFIFALLFLCIVGYLIYIKYFSNPSSIKEGMKESKIKEIINRIANDTNPNSTNKNKLTAIQNLLLVSSNKLPTEEDINAKNAMIQIAGLPKDEQAEKLKRLSEKAEIIYPYLKEVYPQFDMNFWKNILTNSIKNNIPIDGITANSIKYTFNEKIYSIITNTTIEDSEKIRLIKELTKRKPKASTKIRRGVSNYFWGKKKSKKKTVVPEAKAL